MRFVLGVALLCCLAAAPGARGEESDALGTVHDLTAEGNTVTLYPDEYEARRGCKALDENNVEVPRGQADHCCTDEPYCCGGKDCAPFPGAPPLDEVGKVCGFRFVCRRWQGKSHGKHDDDHDKHHDDDEEDDDEEDDDEYEHHEKGKKHHKHGDYHDDDEDDDEHRVNKKVVLGVVCAAVSVALIAIALAVRWCRRRQQADVPLAAVAHEIPVQDRPFELDQLESGGKVHAWADVVKPEQGAPPAGALDYLANHDSKPGTPQH